MIVARLRVRGGIGLWVRLTLVAAALWTCLLAWALSSPPGSAPDEPAHLAASWAVTHGQSADADTYLVPRVLWAISCHSSREKSPITSVMQAAPCFPPTGPIGPELLRGPNTTHLYPVAFHWLLGQFLRTDVTTSVYTMRTVVATGCVLLVMVPLVLISVISGTVGLRRFGIPLLVCLSPLALFLFASINPSAWDMAGAVCAWGCLVAMAQARRRVHVAWALGGIVLGVVAGVVSRPLGGLLTLAGIALAAPVVLTRIAPAAPRRRRWFWASVTGVYTIVGALAAGLLVRGVAAIQWGWSTAAQDRYPPLWHWLTDALTFGHYVTNSFTGLGWLDTPVPSLVGLMFVGASGYLVLAAVRQGRTAVTLSLAMLIIASFAVTTAILATSNPPDTGAQTRYLWPLFIGVVMTAAAALGTARKATDRALAGHVRPVMAVAVTLATSIAFFTNVRRYTVGLTDFPFLTPARWLPPTIGLVQLFALFLGSYVALVLLLTVPSLQLPRRRPAVADSADAEPRFAPSSAARVAHDDQARAPNEPPAVTDPLQGQPA